MGNLSACLKRDDGNVVEPPPSTGLKRKQQNNLDIANEYNVGGTTPSLHQRVETNPKSSMAASVSVEEQKKKEKIRSRIETFEKLLPMRKLTIKEWVKVVNGGDEEETTT